MHILRQDTKPAKMIKKIRRAMKQTRKKLNRNKNKNLHLMCVMSVWNWKTWEVSDVAI